MYSTTEQAKKAALRELVARSGRTLSPEALRLLGIAR